ncbi:YfhO family protein [Enterococcus sp. AZ192]|uniref:YfhO family protein n=1 Tax=unclassified Enterococcus TaxID=2608891 RepID=UPI003D2A6740
MKKVAIKEFIKKNSVAILLSVCLPILIMTVVYYLRGIYPGSSLSIMASDSYSQYSVFHASFKNVLEGKQSIFYTWSGSLGLNYWALAAYYLNGIFTPLVGLFSSGNIPDALYFLTLIKFGAMGLSFWVFAHNTYKLNRWLTVSLSVAYALMSYAVGYSEVIMWLDTFVYLPLIILGVHRLMDKQKPVLLFISYLALFLSNFYMAFMVGVFSFLYFIARLFTDPKRYKNSVIPYLITSFLAGGASMVTILPTIIDLATNGEGLNTFDKWLTVDTGAWDFVAKSLVGVYDTSQYQSMPFIYIGLIPLIFCIYYFVSKQIPLKNKVLYGILLLFLMASVYIYPLNLLWHGMHAPYMFLFRFSFLISFLMILLAGYGLEVVSKEEINRFTNIVLTVVAVFILFLLVSNKKRYGIISTESLIITIALLVIYLAIWLVYYHKPKMQKAVMLMLFVFMLGETAFNSYMMILGINSDWGYVSRDYYTDGQKDIEKLVAQTESENDTFYRMENLNTTTINESFKYGYHGVKMFSSIRNRHSSQYLNSLGFRSLGTNLIIDYSNNTLLADTLLGMKYNISSDKGFNKFGYKKVGKSGDFTLYENQYALPLGVMTDKGIYKKDAVKNQTELFNHLTETSETYFSFGDAPIIESDNVEITENRDTIDLGEAEAGYKRSLKFLVTVPAKSQGYLSLVPLDLATYGKVNVHFSIDGNKRASGLTDTGQYYDLGYYEETTSVEVSVDFINGPQNITIYRPEAVFLNTEKFAEETKKMQEKAIDFTVDGRQANAEVSLDEDQVLLTTIPYDKGWKAYIDGEKVEITTFKDAFLSLKIPKGQHEIQFVYLPQGFAIGASLFVGCILLFILFVYIIQRKKQKNGLTIQQGESRK